MSRPSSSDPLPAGQAPSPVWQGRFPENDIITLLEVNRPFNLAESTSQDLRLGDLIDLVGLDRLRALKLGYGTPAGSAELRSAIAAGCQVSPEQVLTTQGTALALFLLAFECCRPGDEVVLLSPCFPPSRDALIGAGADVRALPLEFAAGYQPDPDRVAAMLSPRTRLVSLASPQNPSGVQVSRAVIEQLRARMDVRCPQALLFVDETYREASYGSQAPMDSVASLHPRIVTGASVSKALGAPGLRTGWLTVPDPALRQRLIVAKMNLIISGSVLDEALATALLQQREQFLAPRRRLLAQGLETVAAWCAREAARIEWIRPDAGALCCMRLRPDRFDEAAVARFWQRLPQHDLQLASGTWFGEQARVFRLGFGYLPLDCLGPALSALSAALDAVQHSHDDRA